MELPSLPPAEPAQAASRSWAWMLALAIVLMLLGLAATSALAFSARAFVVVLGWLMVGAGVLQIGGAFLYRGFGGFGAELFFGALSLALGLALIWAPVVAGSLIALVIVVGLVGDAVLEGVRATRERRSGWIIPLALALLSLGLGVAIIVNPSLLLPLLGLLVGANLFVRGVILLLAALELRSLGRRGAARASAP